MHSDTPHILVIRFSAMGDVALTVPVLRSLTQKYPDVKITVLSRNFFKPLFQEFPQINFFPADLKGRHKGLSGLFTLSKELKRLGVTHVADLHNVLRTKVLRKFLTSSAIKIQKIDKGRKEKKALTRAKNKLFVPLKPTVERYADVFEELGFAVDMSAHRFPGKKVLKNNAASFFSAMQKNIGIAPFAAHPGKMYPPDLMEEVIKKLDASGKYRILLFGGGDQEAVTLNQFESKFSNVKNLAGKLSFEEELSVIANLKLMLAMDSGNAHLAAIYGVPTLTLWGVTHPYAGFYPFNQPLENALTADREIYPLIPTSVYGNKIPAGYENAMRTIIPEQVIEKIQSYTSS